MDEAKILATVESDTFKYTGVPCGTWEDLVLLAMRGGSDSASIVQSGDTCISTICRLRMDTKTEAGDSALYITALIADFGTHWYISRITERVITLGGTGRFGGCEPSSVGPMGMVAVGRFELRTVTPFSGRVKTPPNPTGAATNSHEWRQSR